MELRTLAYFLAIAQEGSLTRAAKALHVTQPTLSRQLSSLEKELGQQLYVRTHAGIELTQAGEVLRSYAASIVELAEKTKDAVSITEREVSGPVYLGLGETRVVFVLARAMERVRREHPKVSFRIRSGNVADLMDGLVSGALDFLLECDVRPHHDLNELDLPGEDAWGVVMRADDPLATRKTLLVEDLAGRDLILSSQEARTNKNAGDSDSLSLVSRLAQTGNVVATFTLAYNTRFLVRAGLGVAVVYEGLVEVGGKTGLVFAPLIDAPSVPTPPRQASVSDKVNESSAQPAGVARDGEGVAITARHGLLWRKVLLSKQAQLFLDAVRAECAAPPATSFA